MSSKSGRQTTTMRIAPSFREVWLRRLRPRHVSTVQFTDALAGLTSTLNERDLDALAVCATTPSPLSTPAKPRLRRSRRGVLDSLTILFVLFIGAVLLVALGWIALNFSATLSAWGSADPSMASATSQAADAMSRVPGILNVVFGLSVFALATITIGLAYLTPSHPMLAFIVIPVLILGVYFGSHLSNTWDAMQSSADGDLRTAMDQMPLLTLVFKYVVELIVGIIILAGIALYGGTKRLPASSGGSGYG